MEISASAMAEGNPGCNIGNFLQMIQSVGSGQSTATGTNETGSVAGGANGNPFSQILLQQIALLLQTGSGELSDAAAKEELASALQKLLEGDQAATGDVLSGLALLALTGQQAVGNQAIVSGETLAGENAVGGQAEGKDFLHNGQLTSFIVQAIQNALKESDATGDDQQPVKMGALPAGEALAKILKENAGKDGTDSQKTGAAFAAEMENLVKKGEGNKNHISGLKEQALSNTDPSAGKLQTQTGEQASSLQDATKGAAADQMTAMKNAAAQMQGEKSAGENASVESQLNKAGADIKTMISEQGTKLSTSNGEKSEGDNPDALKVTAPGSDAKKKISTEADILHNDHRMDAAVQESKNNTAGKDMNGNATVTMESAGAADKIKTELKGKVVNVEKNPENNYLNSTNLSAGVQTKPETGDVSSSSIVNRVAAEFRENLMGEGGRVKIILTPPSLGSLEMDVSVQNSRVKVMLIAENKDVQKILSGNLETLKSTLQSQGLTIERCDVMMQDSRDEYPQGFNGQQAFGQDQEARQGSSLRQPQDDKPSASPSVLRSSESARRLHYTGSESISLFA